MKRKIGQAEKIKIIKESLKEYGIKLEGIFIFSGKEKVRFFTGSLSKEELNFLLNNCKVEVVGISLGKIQDKSLRLSFDAANLFGKEAKKVININDEEAKKWLQGFDIEIKEQKGFFIIKHKEDILGCGKSTGNKILNGVPKEKRMVKTK